MQTSVWTGHEAADERRHAALGLLNFTYPASQCCYHLFIPRPADAHRRSAGTLKVEPGKVEWSTFPVPSTEGDEGFAGFEPPQRFAALALHGISSWGDTTGSWSVMTTRQVSKMWSDLWFFFYIYIRSFIYMNTLIKVHISCTVKVRVFFSIYTEESRWSKDLMLLCF